MGMHRHRRQGAGGRQQTQAQTGRWQGATLCRASRWEGALGWASGRGDRDRNVGDKWQGSKDSSLAPHLLLLFSLPQQWEGGEG